MPPGTPSVALISPLILRNPLSPNGVMMMLIMPSSFRIGGTRYREHKGNTQKRRTDGDGIMIGTSRGGVHHTDLNVSDLAASRAVYGPVLEFLGYTRVKDEATGCEWDLQRE